MEDRTAGRDLCRWYLPQHKRLGSEPDVQRSGRTTGEDGWPGRGTRHGRATRCRRRLCHPHRRSAGRPRNRQSQHLRYTAVQDVGKAVHPSYVEGQMQGGAVQGIGWALNEEYFYNDKGVMANASFLDYRMPTSLDLPMIDTILVEVPNPGHPFGVRGVGEVPIVPPVAAIANAIYKAVGVRMRHSPMSPARVMTEILTKG